MSALVFALAGWRVLLLGVDTPVDQIAALAREAPIAAVALSCAAPGGREAAESLGALRRRLPRRLPLLVGGAGAPPARGQAGVEVLADLTALERWLRMHPAV
jgi:cobalamin-dependent methionine synthase I